MGGQFQCARSLLPESECLLTRDHADSWLFLPGFFHCSSDFKSLCRPFAGNLSRRTCRDMISVGLQACISTRLFINDRKKQLIFRDDKEIDQCVKHVCITILLRAMFWGTLWYELQLKYASCMRSCQQLSVLPLAHYNVVISGFFDFSWTRRGVFGFSSMCCDKNIVFLPVLRFLALC